VLAGHGSAFERMEMAIAVFQRELIVPFVNSTDAEELFATNMALAEDITLEARAKLLSMLTQTLIAATENREIDLDPLQAQPAQLANIIVAAMDGIKHAQRRCPDLEADTRLFIRLLRVALMPRTGQ
jgi:hypothetical protein